MKIVNLNCASHTYNGDIAYGALVRFFSQRIFFPVDIHEYEFVRFSLHSVPIRVYVAISVCEKNLEPVT